MLHLFTFQQIVAFRRDARIKDRQLLTAQQQVFFIDAPHSLSLLFSANNFYVIFINTAPKQGTADPRTADPNNEQIQDKDQQIQDKDQQIRDKDQQIRRQGPANTNQWTAVANLSATG